MTGEHIHVHLHVEPDQRTLDALERIESRLGGLSTGVNEMALDLSGMQAEISENTDVVQSAASLLGRLAQEIRDAAGDPAALEALATQLDQNNQALAQAVAANTPSSPDNPPA
jgi:methyl-accepting chemotaxis protein